MKRFFRLITFVCLLPLAGKSATVTVGVDTSFRFFDFPINRWYNYSASEMVYLSDELKAAGQIGKLAFYRQNSAGGTVSIDSILIFMKETTRDTFATFGKITFAGYKLVYKGRFPNSSTTPGWREVTLDSSFNYSGSKNLSVLVLNSQKGAAFSTIPYYCVERTASKNRTAYYRSDTVPWSDTCEMIGTYYRPNLRLEFTTVICPALVPGTISGPVVPVCPETGSFSLVCSGATSFAGVKYQWQSRPARTSLPFTDMPDDTTLIISKTITTATDFRMNIRCVSSAAVDSSGVFTVDTLPRPATPVVTQTGMTLNVASTYASYQWYKDGRPITGATSYTYNVTATGVYTVVVTGSNGCMNTSAPLSVVGTHIAELTGEDAYKVYPVPATEKLYVEARGWVRVQMRNSIGQLIFDSWNATEIDLRDLPPAVYLLTISDNDGVVLKTTRVIKAGS